MYTRHFLKMLFYLACMALLGMAGLFVANHYAASEEGASAGAVPLTSIKK